MAHANVFMPIAARAQLSFRVIRMNYFWRLKADCPLELGHGALN
jgi:hypothetical protein